MVDRDLIHRRLALLDTYLEQLTPYRMIEHEAYAQDWKTQRIVEPTLHLAIETCMDVADHIVADRRLRVPESGLPKHPGPRLRRLDASVVVRVLREDLGDLERFRDRVRTVV